MSKCSSVLLIFLLVSSSSLMSSLVCATTSNPSVPEFTLKTIARPFNIPAVTTTNPYNGQTTITREGYYVANISVDITIKNQSPYTTNYIDGISIWYQVQFKGAYQTNWQTYHAPVHNTIEYTDYIFQQIGDYTVISIPIDSDDPINLEGEHSGSITNFPENGRVDFQVRALIGHPYVKQSGLMGDMVYFDGETGDWSNTQTITIDENTHSATPDVSLPSQSVSPTESYNPTQTKPSTQITIQLGMDSMQLVVFALLGIIAVFVAVIAVFLYKRGKK